MGRKRAAPVPAAWSGTRRSCRRAEADNRSGEGTRRSTEDRISRPRWNALSLARSLTDASWPSPEAAKGLAAPPPPETLKTSRNYVQGPRGNTGLTRGCAVPYALMLFYRTRGEIGIHARFRSLWPLRPWGFNSLRVHFSCPVLTVGVWFAGSRCRGTLAYPQVAVVRRRPACGSVLGYPHRSGWVRSTPRERFTSGWWRGEQVICRRMQDEDLFERQTGS